MRLLRQAIITEIERAWAGNCVTSSLRLGAGLSDALAVVLVWIMRAFSPGVAADNVGPNGSIYSWQLELAKEFAHALPNLKSILTRISIRFRT